MVFVLGLNQNKQKKMIEKRIKPNKIDFNFYNARQLGNKTYSEYLHELTCIFLPILHCLFNTICNNFQGCQLKLD